MSTISLGSTHPVRSGRGWSWRRLEWRGWRVKREEPLTCTDWMGLDSCEYLLPLLTHTVDLNVFFPELSGFICLPVYI